eukprot:TRINITY_DN2397_c0_g1_i1.p1 TRINITY_DN2397_c0_g1~~TRINITY_DN2397_c0_g1_i1.p1  ORF type:complete len:469 (+),score=78.29 TRINITY_DN2397_c0_g1_i1:1010-2416(+)
MDQAGLMKVLGAGAVGVGLCLVSPRLAVEMSILKMRVGYAALTSEGGWWATQKEIQFVIGLERTRRLNRKISHVDTGRGRGKAERGNGKRLVLVGGGHSHAYTLKDFYTNPMEGVEVVLVTKTKLTPYSGMLPGYIAGVYTFEECHLNLEKICAAANITLILAEVTHIDTASQTVHYKTPTTTSTTSYDVLSIDIGSAPRCAIDSSKVVPVKPIDSLDVKWKSILKEIVAIICAGKTYSLVIVGGGGSGAEMTLSMEARLTKEIRAQGGDATLLTVVLVSKNGELLPNHCKEARMEMAKEYRRRGVAVIRGEAVKWGDVGLVLADGREVPCDSCLWCTDAGTGSWLKGTDIALEDGFVKVNEFMQSVSHENIFAAGDCASLPTPVAKAGVFAVREGPPLTANLKSLLTATTPAPPLTPFTPPKSFLGLFGTGYPSNCIASRGPMATSAGWLWELKDWIDRTWMAEYTF